MKSIKVVPYGSSDEIKLNTDGNGNFSLEISGYPVSGGEDEDNVLVSVLLNYKELHELLVKSELMLDGKIK